MADCLVERSNNPRQSWEVAAMSGIQEERSWWKRRYDGGPLTAFVIASLLGGATGVIVALVIDHRDSSLAAIYAVISAASGGIIGSTYALHVYYPVWSERCRMTSGFLLLVSVAVGLHFGIWQAAANHGWLAFLILFGGFSGLVYFTVCGICGLVLGAATFRGSSRHEASATRPQ